MTITEMLTAALQHHQVGRLQEAEALYRQILQIKPDHADALHLLGVIAHQVGRHEVAVEYIGRAIGLNSGVAEYHNNIGEAWRALGKLEEAANHYRRALSINPSYAEAHSNLGIVLRWQGKPEEGRSHFSSAITLNPSLAQAHYNLGIALQAEGRLAEADASYRRALALKPDFVDAQINLVMVMHGQGRRADALKILFDGLAAQPTNAQLRGALASSLHGDALHTVGESVSTILLSLCSDDNISTQELVPAIIGLVKNAPAFPPLLRAARSGEDPFASAASEAKAFTRDPLLLAALPRTVVCNAELEQVLTHMRRWILLRARAGAGLAAAEPAISYPFLCALARQCFNNEYVFYVSRDETRRVRALQARLHKALHQPVTVSQNLERSLVLAALYGSLHNLAGRERLLDADLAQWSEPFQPIAREQLINHKKEQDIASRLTALTEIKDEVSRKVHRMYEENPYPRWITIQRPKVMAVESLVRSLRPGEVLGGFPRPASILIAGCGSGHQPIQTAMAFSECQVLAIDLSRASLAYAARMAERFGVTNITFHQADLLELGKLDRRFAIIECGGVLHALKDPLRGWRVLVGLLEPDGLMKIGLYSTKARRNILIAREFVREQKFPPTADGIRKCRRAILDLPEGHAARGALTSRDFFSTSECRDLIMHVQEHTFTTPELADCLEQLGLRFLGFQLDLHTMERFRNMFSEKSALTDLFLWDRFEEANPGTFGFMYQFWCCRE